MSIWLSNCCSWLLQSSDIFFWTLLWFILIWLIKNCIFSCRCVASCHIMEWSIGKSMWKTTIKKKKKSKFDYWKFWNPINNKKSFCLLQSWSDCNIQFIIGKVWRFRINTIYFTSFTLVIATVYFQLTFLDMGEQSKAWQTSSFQNFGHDKMWNDKSSNRNLN